LQTTGHDQIRPAPLRMMVYTSLFSALIAAGAYVFIPIGPVPIVLQNMFVFLAGLLLPVRWAFTCVGVYLLAGSCGLPVFAGGLGGIARLIGPTGGYLIGYLPAVYVIGKVVKRTGPSVYTDVTAMVCGSVILYACGLWWLKILTAMTWSKTLAVGLYPFLIGDGLKIAAAAAISRALRPIIGVSGSVSRDARFDRVLGE